MSILTLKSLRALNKSLFLSDYFKYLQLLQKLFSLQDKMYFYFLVFNEFLSHAGPFDVLNW